VAIPKRVEARLVRLEASVKALPDPAAEREKERVSKLHYWTWLLGGPFEDIPEKDRDPELWEQACRYGHVLLEYIWEGAPDEREELLAAGVDFTQVEGIDEDDVRDHINRTSDPNSPHKP
jgi:hypothetical protein